MYTDYFLQIVALGKEGTGFEKAYLQSRNLWLKIFHELGPCFLWVFFPLRANWKNYYMLCKEDLAKV